MLKDKVAIVTGASRGIGKDIALGFAREGANVVVAARSDQEKDERFPGTIHKTADEIQEMGRRALPVKCDITEEESVKAMVEAALQEFGTIDILVNNAGVAFYYPVVETPLKKWEIVLNVNLKGVFLCSRAVLPTMIEKKSGAIINISSLAGQETRRGNRSHGSCLRRGQGGCRSVYVGARHGSGEVQHRRQLPQTQKSGQYGRNAFLDARGETWRVDNR